MKRYSDNFSPGRWKRICPPAEDSDSDSSSDSDSPIDIYRRLFGYGGPNCTHCDFPNLVCSCSLQQKLTTSSRQSMILLDPVDSIERVEGPAGGNGTSHASASSSNGNSSSSSSGYQPSLRSGMTPTGHSDTSNERSSVSFRASTSIQQFRVRPPPRSTMDYENRQELGLFSDEDGTINLFGSPKLHDFSHGNRPRESPESSIEVITSSATVGAASSSATTVGATTSSSATVAATTSSVATVAATTAPAEREINNELDEFHARLLSLIECPVCLEPISPPIHQCRRGHLVCGKCKSQLNQCPTCRDRMSEMRNFAVERMAELLKYPCRNAGLGCPVAILLSGKNAHESTCPFRHYNCLFRTCSWTGFQQEMVPHLRSTHSLRFLEGSRQEIDVELNSPTLFYTDWALSCFGRIFRLNVFQHIPNSMFYVSAYLVGSRGRSDDVAGRSESDFTYTVTVNGSLGRRASYTRQTHAESTRTSQLCHSEDCFSIRGDKLEHFTRDRGSKLRLHVELQQLDTSSHTFQDN
ncbi:E3 ubiquitin-protein ligase sina-like isoform X1 [Daphnia carinata]|uniref:E3 ubiquitin-protein ligase sina-like isoform X1 n=2 Tax=Daphnia carinata TaxID=120202 RepID=UPI00257FF35A|nr:E3 ubiquitin-protein ligase sina-like isoform X1 [Daphnia carinata]